MNGTFNLIKGSRDIAKFLGYTESHIRHFILPEMFKYNCAFKMNNKKGSPWVTTPFFINLYIFLKNTHNHSNKPTIKPQSNHTTPHIKDNNSDHITTA